MDSMHHLDVLVTLKEKVDSDSLKHKLKDSPGGAYKDIGGIFDQVLIDKNHQPEEYLREKWL